MEKNGFSRAPEGYKGGRVFENRYNDLPSQSKGYYKEWDTKSIADGGRKTTERLVTGKNGEVYYTNSHYGQANNGNPAFLKVNKHKN